MPEVEDEVTEQHPGIGRFVSRNAVLLGLVIQFLVWLYTSGGQNAKINESLSYLSQRVSRLESQMDSINHITRGVPEGQEIPLPKPRP